ncbi:ABC transporter permease [Falsiroseomonas oryzae]|uniref:ABC transporter permease n=1 Tax=Falsiroseomonas oryzae TaxID=2766473 RepID=UPI0022EA5845|nr:ABC transporter permease [Roseomonas sp. MO-31]
MRRFYWSLVLVPLAVLAVLYLYPLATVLWLSVTEPRPGLQNFSRLVESAALQRILWNTARISIITTAIALVVGYAIAYALVHMDGRRRAIMLGALLASFWLSVLIRSFAWLTLLQSRGVVNSTLMGMGLIDAPIPLVRNEFGVVLGMVHYMIPYAALPMYASMQAMDLRLVPAARSLGASRWQSFRRVFLPLSLPGVFSAGVLCFIFSLGFYVTPALLGGGRVIMIAEYIAVQIQETLNWGLGTMLATTLLLSVLLLLAAVSRIVDVRAMFGAK